MSSAARVRGTKVQPPVKKTEAAVETTVEAVLKRVVAVLEDYKALDVVVIGMANKSSFADFMVVATGTSSRHVASMGQALHEKLGKEVLGAEGLREGEWVCVDAGSVVVHVFVPEKRVLYNLEKLWSYEFKE